MKASTQPQPAFAMTVRCGLGDCEQGGLCHWLLTLAGTFWLAHVLFSYCLLLYEVP